MGSFVPFIPSLAEGPAPSGASGSAVEAVEGSTARPTWEASPQPPGSRLADLGGLPASTVAGPALTFEARPPSRASVPALFARPARLPRSTRWSSRGAGPRGQRFGQPVRPLSGGSLPRRSLAGLPRAQPRGDTFTGKENKPLTAISNRNSNDSRKPATLSESMTSDFLIATKLHVSEEKAKSEEKGKALAQSSLLAGG
jgi:hypothetical protein